MIPLCFLIKFLHRFSVFLWTKQWHKFAENNSNQSFVVSDVPMWLKGLRLHKYTPLFQQLEYDQMMQLDEQQLELRVRFYCIFCIDSYEKCCICLSSITNN